MMAVIKRQSPFGYVIICDDIRQEANNKLSYIGVYAGHELSVFTDKWPVTLPKLAFSISFGADKETLLSLKEICIFLPGDSEENPTVRIPPPPKEIFTVQKPEGIFDTDGDLMRGVTSAIVISPITINEEGRIRVIAFLGNDSFKLGSLLVKKTKLPDELTAGLTINP
jgi:hypothetical protein